MRFPMVVYPGPIKEHSWVRWSVNRVKRRNNSTNIRFIGDTGSGKSWSALAFCEMCAKLLGRKLTSDDIYFSITEIIRKINRDEPPPGTIFFLDEQQIEASSTDHNTTKGKAYSAFMSTVRSNRYIFVSTLPFADMTIKKVRRFFHVEIETLGVDFNTQTVLTKPRYLEHSKREDKTYYKRLLVISKPANGASQTARKLDLWKIPSPSADLVKEYEAKKKEFKRALYKKLAAELEKYEGNDIKEDDSQVPRVVSTKDPEPSEVVLQTLTPFQREIFNIKRSSNCTQNELVNKLIAAGFKSNQGKVSLNMKWMRQKGVIFA